MVLGGKEGVPSVPVKFPNAFDFKLGASYIITVTKNLTDPNLNDPSEALQYAIILHTITKESSLHMLWLLPQYIVITAAEIMFSITGLEFSYSQVRDACAIKIDLKHLNVIWIVGSSVDEVRHAVCVVDDSCLWKFNCRHYRCSEIL